MGGLQRFACRRAGGVKEVMSTRTYVYGTVGILLSYVLCRRIVCRRAGELFSSEP